MDDYDDYSGDIDRAVETATKRERGAWEAVVVDIAKANVERVRGLQEQVHAAEGRVRYLEGVCKEAKVEVYTSPFYRREQ
jgi:hypothetical protein